MIRYRAAVPLDYSLCVMTVTVYTPQGERRVKTGVHLEQTRVAAMEKGRTTLQENFLLVIPGEDPIAPGDKVLLGIGPEDVAWEALNPAQMPGLCLVRSVKPRYFRNTLCHTEARG